MRESERHSFRRTVRRLAGTAILTTLLVGCQAADELGYGPKHLRSVSYETKATMRELNMSETSPVLMRIFKEENVFEVWKKDRTGRYALLKTYEICKWSGNLGPKIREGDRQAPEGYYTITPGLMNPNSQYHLAFNTGFPNAYDRAHERTGSALMVHGACSSRGCYAMTDEQIQEIYALARDAFRGGQKAFQLQAYPFRMTAENMARHWSSPNMPFWKMLKEGYDTFELTRMEPKVDVCDRRYVFNAGTKATLSPVASCPPLEQPVELVAALRKKAAEDEQKAIVIAARLDEERRSDEERRTLIAQRTEQLRVAELERQQRAASGNGGNLLATVWGDGPGTTASLPANGGATGEATALAMAAGDPGQSGDNRSMFGRLFSFGDDVPPAPTVATAVAAPAAGSEAATATMSTVVPPAPKPAPAASAAPASPGPVMPVAAPAAPVATPTEAPAAPQAVTEVANTPAEAEASSGWWPFPRLF